MVNYFMMEMFDTFSSRHHPPGNAPGHRPWTQPPGTSPLLTAHAHHPHLTTFQAPHHHTPPDHRTHQLIDAPFACRSFLPCANNHGVPSTQHSKPAQRQPCVQTSYTFYSASTATTCSELVQVKWSIVTPGVTWEEVGGNSRRKALGGNTSSQTASRSPLNGFVCCTLRVAFTWFRRMKTGVVCCFARLVVSRVDSRLIS